MSSSPLIQFSFFPHSFFLFANFIIDNYPLASVSLYYSVEFWFASISFRSRFRKSDGPSLFSVPFFFFSFSESEWKGCAKNVENLLRVNNLMCEYVFTVRCLAVGVMCLIVLFAFINFQCFFFVFRFCCCCHHFFFFFFHLCMK